MESRPRLFFFSLLFLASAAFSGAHIADFDEYWQKKAEVARSKARNYYNPNPESVIRHFNEAVYEYVSSPLDAERNVTRRGLRGKKRSHGPCLATNPSTGAGGATRTGSTTASSWPRAPRASAATPPEGRRGSSTSSPMHPTTTSSTLRRAPSGTV
ncbi:unnamed protein product [Musa textilis]